MDMVEEYGLTSPYEYVNEDNWTFDTFSEPTQWFNGKSGIRGRKR